MSAIRVLVRSGGKAARGVLAILVTPAIGWGAQVGFDVPTAVECRDVTPPEFAIAHPRLKVVEAKVRISARMIEGTLSDIVEFSYVLKTNPMMRITGYLPNTTLESSVAEDSIEITGASEHSKALGLDAHIAYKPALLGGTFNQGSKNSESSHYKQIAAKDLVLASGTIDREHGVFFRLRPSRSRFPGRQQGVYIHGHGSQDVEGRSMPRFLRGQGDQALPVLHFGCAVRQHASASGDVPAGRRRSSRVGRRALALAGNPQESVDESIQIRRRHSSHLDRSRRAVHRQGHAPA